MLKFFLLICLLLTCWAKPLNAQSQCTVTHYDEFSGMAQWQVTRIVQDKQGMMWFATWNGLNRYDGYEFECFKSRVGDGIDMTSDRIQDMILADDGSLRCYVEGKVYGFSTKTCRYFQIPKTEEQSLKKMFDQVPKRDEAFVLKGEPNYYIDIYGTEWVIGQNGWLKYKDPSNRLVDYPANWHGADRIRFCMADKKGDAWFISSYGVFKLTFYRKPYQQFKQEAPGQIRAFWLDRQQRYWISNRDDMTIRLYDYGNRFLGYLGRDGRLHAQYTSFGSPVYHITQDSKGTFWLCSKPDGLFRLKEADGGSFSIRHYGHVEGDDFSLSGNDLYYAVEDKQGRLWLATFNTGVNCIPDPQAEQPLFLHSGNGLQCSIEEGFRVRQLHITQQQIMLAATTNGLLVADISPKDARQIRFRRHVKDANRSNSLSNNATMYVSEDTQHRVYVCTESGGVNQIISENLLDSQLNFRHFNLSTNFPSDVALSAIPFGNELIVVSNNQIICLRPDSTNSRNSESFLWQDKLRFSDATPLQLPDGRTIFGLQDGALTLNLKKIQKSEFVPPIVLTKLSVENGPEDYAVNRLDTLILAPPQRDFFLQFAALDYSADGTIDYAFRLGSEDESWNYIGKDHSATFLDMKPGTYQLQIRSTNSDGVWVDNVRVLTIIVKPTFWETQWAQLLYLFILILVAWGIFYTRRYILRLKQRQNELHEAYLALLNAKEDGHLVQVQTEQPSKPVMRPEDETFMQRAMTFIEEHLSDPDINIGDMAEATATSRSGLNRKMKSLLGVTPLDFIREARIRKACQLLRGGASVNDVAYKCGFSDPKYFGRCFKAEIGMTPTEYKADNPVK